MGQDGLMRDPSAEPPLEAYGRVSDAERFRILHGQVYEVILDLARRYAVEPSMDPSVWRQECHTEELRLTPEADGAAELSFSLTDFPGAAVRFGRWHEELYPWCGCDACDDDPELLMEDLRCKVGSLVNGRFAEHVRAGLNPRFSYDFGHGRGSRGIDRRTARERLRRHRRRTEWRAWTPRLVSSDG